MTTAYITRDILETLFGTAEIAKLETAGAGIVETIATTNSEVDGYVRVARPDGVDPVPKSLEMAAANICRFYLYKNSPPAIVETRWKAAIAYLRDISAGKVALPAIPDDPDTDIDESTVNDRIWSESPDRMVGW